MNRQELIERAEDILDIEIIETPGGRMYHLADDEGPTRGYYVTAKDLRYALDVARDPNTRDDAYSHWCAVIPNRYVSDRIRAASEHR